MSHSHHHSAGSSSKIPHLTEFPKFYHAVVGSVVAIATLVNIYTHILCRQRLSIARLGAQTPAKPKSWFSLLNATLFALTREASNFSIHIPIKTRVFRLPSVGRTSLVIANVVVLVVLCLYGLDLNDQFTREDLGYRCGVVTVAQLPIVFLLSSKNNIVGYLSGVSYERLNWLHRWCARCMLLTATMHMGWFFSAWAPYDYIGIQLKENKLAWRGLAAWCILVWIVFSSMTPLRGWCYELFVLQHVASFAIFLYFVYIHTPAELHVYVWIAIGVVLYDRIFRALRVIYANFSLFRPVRREDGQMEGIWSCKAEFTSLPHDTTRIVIRSPSIGWSPGQHVFLSCQSIAPLQNHPFTISSIPEDGMMEFFVKAQSGGTRHFSKYAQKTSSLLDGTSRIKLVTIEGPYGTHRPLRQFDSVVLLAGSTGATFTIPLLRDILQGWKENTDYDANDKRTWFLKTPGGAVTRYVRFVWVIKSRKQLGMFSEKLSTVFTEFEFLQNTLRDIKLELTVYVTCDETFTEQQKSLLSKISASKPVPKQDIPEHGTVEQCNHQPSIDNPEKNAYEMHNLTELKNPTTKSPGTCTPQNLCCCRASIDEHSRTKTTCTCVSALQETPHTTTSSSTCPSSSTSLMTPTSFTQPAQQQQQQQEEEQSPSLHPSIRISAGRPQTRDIIRRSLEQAWGESAVVVCGPQSLLEDVKRDVCALSDERAVHKGTGAQGIYLHTEGFGW